MLSSDIGCIGNVVHTYLITITHTQVVTRKCSPRQTESFQTGEVLLSPLSKSCMQCFNGAELLAFVFALTYCCL